MNGFDSFTGCCIITIFRGVALWFGALLPTLLYGTGCNIQGNILVEQKRNVCREPCVCVRVFPSRHSLSSFSDLSEVLPPSYRIYCDILSQNRSYGVFRDSSCRVESWMFLCSNMSRNTILTRALSNSPPPLTVLFCFVCLFYVVLNKSSSRCRI